MKPLNILFTLTSLNVLLVTIERFSFTDQILLPPYHFLRLHEVLQITTLILFTVLIPSFILKIVSQNFKDLTTKYGFMFFLSFVIGVYFYATGNGIHEVSSFNFNNFCNIKSLNGEMCKGFFFNDYYTGNIFYFIGALLINIPLLLLELKNPSRNFTKKDLIITLINALVYALAIFAYAGFDQVLVGLVYSISIMIIADLLWLKIKAKPSIYPIISYTALAYTVGTFASMLVRLKG